MAKMTPSELRSGLVKQEQIHGWLAQLYETPEWNSRVHWRPKLQVHYFDAIAMIQHRLKATAPGNENVVLLQAELDGTHSVNHGEQLFHKHDSVKELNARNTSPSALDGVTNQSTAVTAAKKAKTILEALRSSGAASGGAAAATYEKARKVSELLDILSQFPMEPLEFNWRLQSLKSELRDYAWETSTNVTPKLFKYRLDICHIVALKIRNDEMLKGSWHGISRSFPRSAKMINSRLTTLIQKMTTSAR